MKTIDEVRRQNLAVLAAELGTVTALAKVLDRDVAQVSQWMNGSLNSGTGKPRGIRSTSCRYIEERCGKEPGWMDRPHSAESAIELVPGAMRVHAAGSDDPSLTQIMKVKLKVQAGITGFQVEPEHYDGETQAVPTKWILKEGLSRDALIAITVRGESMEPALYDGDVIVVNTADKQLVSGSVYVVNYEGEAVVKRMQRDMGQWWLTSDNPDQRKYHRQLCKGAECIVIGKVVRKESTHI